jgi:hypothetical protein
MKKISLIFLPLFINQIIFAARNPFEWLQPLNDITNTQPVATPIENQKDISANSTWQITRADEDTVILKNNDGELRKIQMVQ